MCGIIGIFDREDSAYHVKKGLSMLKNRGKDNFGIYDSGKVKSSKTLGDIGVKKDKDQKDSMGHCLHSVVGFVEQPMLERTETCEEMIFTTNCEIYNWKELDNRYHLNASNDAEVILKLIRKQGIKKAIEKLDGVYAFAYWDKKENTVSLARDILGIKPLWYATDKGFAYASEKKVLEKLGYLNIHELNPRKILKFDLAKKTITFVDRKFFDIFPEHKTSHKTIMSRVEKYLEEAIEKRVPDKKFGILFSGGIDSTIIAYMLKRLGYDFTCYTSAFLDKDLKEPQDLVYSKKIAKDLGLKLKISRISINTLKTTLKKVVPLIEDSNVVKVGVAIPFYVACKQAKKDGCKVIFSGLGSEEIFAGYERHRNSSNINNECLSGLLKMYERDLYRDDVITMYNSLELRLPFLDRSLVEYSLKIPEKYKIDDENSKVILRDVAKKIGLKEDFASRKKRAAQYGSNFHKALKKATTRSGKRYISEYLKDFYPRANVKLGALFSSGKDSSYALYVMMRQNYEISCLITLKSENQDSYMFHTPNIDLASLQAKAMDIPLIEQSTQGNKEEELKDLEKALKKAKKEYGIRGVVTGALFSTYQRDRIEKICDKLGLKIFAPLWHMSQEQEMRELISEGFGVVMSSVAAYGLDKSWLNISITGKEIDRLVALDKKFGFNVAGEGGEYESLTLDAPMYKKKLKIEDYEVLEESENVARFNVKKASLGDKS